jgi:hypothetical protein
MISGLKIPKLIGWIFLTGIIFLLLMTMMRLAFFAYFPKQGNHFSDVFSSFVLGLRYDLRDVCIICLLLLIFGSIPFFNPFGINNVRKFCLCITALAAFLLMFFYSVDFAHYSYLSQRLNASILNYFGDAGTSAKMIWQTYPVVKIILFLIVGTWLTNWLIVTALKKINTSKQTSTKRSRILWFIITPLIFAFCIFGKADQFPLRWSDAFALGSDYKANLSLNPFQSFFSSLKFLHSVYDEAKVKNGFPLLANYYGIPESDSSTLNFKRNVAPRKGAVTTTPNVVVVI